LPLTVEEQRTLIRESNDTERALVLLILSTGMHPAVLSKEKYNFTFTNDYYQWIRTKKKKNNIVRGSWSKMMREKGILEAVEELRGKSRQWYWIILSGLGYRVKIGSLGPLRLRHTNFVNSARIGRDAFTISAMAATDLPTIQQYYTIGIQEMGILSDSDKAWLKELMER